MMYALQNWLLTAFYHGAQRTSGSRKRMIKLLQDYMDFLKNAETDDVLEPLQAKSYHLPSEVVLPEEWTEFDNTYQLHCPKLSLEKATRDVSPVVWMKVTLLKIPSYR